MQALLLFNNKNLQELFKQYDCEDSEVIGTGPNGKILKEDRIKYIYKIIYPDYPNIFSYLKNKDMTLIHYLDYTDLFQLSKVNRQLVDYIDNNTLRMILNEKSILYGDHHITEILNPIYDLINSRINHQYKDLNIPWINKSLFISTMKKKVIKVYLQELLLRERKRIRKNAKLTNYKLKISKNITFDEIFKISFYEVMPVSKKLSVYIQPTVKQIDAEMSAYVGVQNISEYIRYFKTIKQKFYNLFFI